MHPEQPPCAGNVPAELDSNSKPSSPARLSQSIISCVLLWSPFTRDPLTLKKLQPPKGGDRRRQTCVIFLLKALSLCECARYERASWCPGCLCFARSGIVRPRGSDRSAKYPWCLLLEECSPHWSATRMLAWTSYWKVQSIIKTGWPWTSLSSTVFSWCSFNGTPFMLQNVLVYILYDTIDLF